VTEYEAFVTKYQALVQLFGGYLSEDWADEYADPWQAIDDFPRSQPSYALKLRSEIEGIIRQYPSEDALFPPLLRLGLGYRIQFNGWTSHRDWLLAVADRVEEVLRKSPAA
jgi:CdiI immunity protein